MYAGFYLLYLAIVCIIAIYFIIHFISHPYVNACIRYVQIIFIVSSPATEVE